MNIPVSMKRYKVLFVFFCILGFCGHFRAAAQEMPPRPVSASFIQNLAFGAFAPSGSGGTVTVSPQGIRFAVGNIVLVGLGYLYYPAIFGLEGNPGTILHPLNGPDAILPGSNGGSITLQLGTTNPGDPIILNVAPPNQMQVTLGGSLLVGDILSNPPGYYSGSFSIMFIQE